MNKLPDALLKKNDKAAGWIIITLSVVMFVAMTALSKTTIHVSLPFNPHVFASINAIINSCVTLLLIAALVMVKKKNYALHKKLMMGAIILSVLFLLSYVAHHLFAEQVRFGDTDFDGVLSESEKQAAGSMRLVYFFILMTHIPLAGIILPLTLFTAYRALTGEYQKHKKLARITWPIWLYVAISGVALYWLICPYYH